MGLWEPLKVQPGEAQSAIPWEEQPQAAVQAGGQTAGGLSRHQAEHELDTCQMGRRLIVFWAALEGVLLSCQQMKGGFPSTQHW